MVRISVNSKVEVRFLSKCMTKAGVEKASFKKPVVRKYRKDGNLDVLGWFVFFCPNDQELKEGDFVKITEINSVVINRTFYNGKSCYQTVINCKIERLTEKENEKMIKKAMEKPTLDVEDSNFDFDFLKEDDEEDVN